MTGRTCLVAFVIATSTTPALAQRIRFDPLGSAVDRAARNDIRQQREQAAQARRAQQELAAREQQMISGAAAEVVAARKAQRAAVQDLKKARDQASEAIQAMLGVKAAQEEVAQAQAEYRELSEPILTKLKATPEFQAEERKSAEALEEIKRLRESKSLSENEKQARMSGLVAQSMAASNLERVTLRNDEGIRRALERVEKAREKLVEIRKSADDRVENDPAVAAARQALAAATEAIQAAEANLVTVRKKIASGAHLFESAVSPASGEQPAPGDAKGNRNN